MTKNSFGNQTILMRAYHGTSLTNVDSIVQKGFIPSTGENQWMGEGVYFFREDLEQAKVWAYHEKSRLLKRKQYTKARKYKGCVFEWKSEFPEENFLNLDTREGAIYYHQHLSEYQEMIESEGLEIEGNWWYHNSLCYEGIDDKYKAIQRTFSVPSKYDEHDTMIFNTLMFLPIKKGKDTKEIEVPNIETHLLNGCQIVVRDSDLIQQGQLDWLAC
ncbi:MULTISPECIES: hypothetical protein [unclassified Exiguobacterium]|uniref:hypothetical protein n=1 Tax=unclassified Exiguobacterium TaxID=2644629 RepID=UPI001BE5C886|nr:MULTISPECIES: hypothetical protein [unclassified Exiguobacterium]